MSTRHRPFVDWMKTAGIFVIVCGHVAAGPINHLTPPIYPKQLGVAMFLFVLGYSLANEHRARGQVVFNRLFDLYVYALPLALILTALAPFRGGLSLSNYLPFLFGANVLVNNLPANPTTWFVGTYLHILMAWALLVRFRIRPWMLGASVVVEVALRASIWASAGAYVAYMSIFNWPTVLLSGIWWGQREQARAATDDGGAVWSWIVLLGLVGTGWAIVMPSHVAAWTFPFVQLSGAIAPLLLTSALVSVVYLTYTFLFLQVARRLPALPIIRFFARNTLFVFLAHMPVLYLLEWLRGPSPLPYAGSAAINLFVCFVGLSVVSEWLNDVIAPRALRERVAARVFPRRPAVAGPMHGLTAEAR